MAFFIQYYN